MFIQSATIGLASSYSLSVTRSRIESTTAWIGDERPDSSQRNSTSFPVANPSSAKEADATISQTARDLLRRSQSQARSLAANASKTANASIASEIKGRKAVNSQGVEMELSPKDELKVRLIEDLLSRLFGHTVKLSRFKGYRLGEASTESESAPPQQEAQSSNAPQKAGWGIDISIQEKETREERSDFQAAGEIRTADGRVLDLSMRLTMASSSTRESSFQFQAGDAVRKDPLVLNFGGNAADLTNATFAFDLEGDGSMENVAFATGDTAFLARLAGGADGGKNIPTDGSALFGTVSGDGFADLASLDGDGNGWIDEADAAWKDLALWSRDESGNDRIQSLASRGVGALYVGSVSTPFELGAGAVAETGVWVSETEAQAGTIQHIDLSV